MLDLAKNDYLGLKSMIKNEIRNSDKIKDAMKLDVISTDI